MKALETSDQNCQRMAWALSQIFVASSTFDFNSQSTVAAPLQQLRSERLRALLAGDAVKYHDREPNENFACEIMQLFVLGLVTMNPDGSSLLVSGQTVERTVRRTS